MPILKRRGGRMGIAPALPILRKKSSHKGTKTQRSTTRLLAEDAAGRRMR